MNLLSLIKRQVRSVCLSSKYTMEYLRSSPGDIWQLDWAFKVKCSLFDSVILGSTTLPHTPVHPRWPVSPSIKYSNGFLIVFVSGQLTDSVFAALCWSRRWRRILLHLLLAFFLLIVVLEEQQRKHAKDAANTDSDGLALHRADGEWIQLNPSKQLYVRENKKNTTKFHCT